MTAYVRQRSVLWRATMDGVLVLRMADGGAMHVIGSGAELWEMLEEPHSTLELTEGLAATYDVAMEQVQPHVQQLIRELGEAGIVVEVTT